MARLFRALHGDLTGESGCVVGGAMDELDSAGTRQSGSWEGVISGPEFNDFFNEPRYTVNEVAEVLGISRTTLVWYEDLGIVVPKRAAGSGWRMYTALDIYRLMGALALKNAGVRPSDLAGRLSDQPFSREHIQEYVLYSEHLEEYYRAQAECFRKLSNIIKYNGTYELVEVEPYYIVFDQSDEGYKHYNQDVLLSKLVSCMPVASLGAVSKADWPVQGARWGRTVPVRFAHLIGSFSTNRQVIGGMKCLCRPTICNLSYEETLPSFIFEEMQHYMDEHGLRASGRLFCPFIFPLEDDSLGTVHCLPVEPDSGAQ